MAWKPNSRDAVWVLLFLALHFSSPIVNTAEVQMLAAFAIFEMIEPRIGIFRDSPGGRFLGVAIRLVLAYLLMGVTGGIASSYYLILLLPVVTAATFFGALGTVAATTMAGLSYLSFLLYIDFENLTIPLDQQQEISFRILFLFLAAYLTYQLARANREQAESYQSLARELAAANKNLQAAQSEVLRSERLAALGQLTAGLAHELRNPLGTIKASAEMLAKKLPAQDALGRELSGYISTEVDRTNELVKRFLDFAKPFRLHVELTELSEVIDRAVHQVRTRAESHRCRVIRNDSPDVHALPIDAQWIEQLVANLLANAIDASPPDSVVTVLTRPAMGGAEVAVIDRGAGIGAENLGSIFNPFFTTKPEGTGLGLAIVSKIVDEHRGRIFVESEIGAGTTIRVWLPDRQEVQD
ncbi:sensor histidine kinase [Bryobacter aggregatus]|uniref:sensor histidine kinase n=1 Tax=Bryobacter aggregatus TaxID=360054 RepID=UPI0004E0F514|nr:ATP-binding protein [Bryobacter aggregatus]